MSGDIAYQYSGRSEWPEDARIELNSALLITQTDDSFLRLFECQAQDVMGKNISALFSPADRQSTASFMERIAQGNRVHFDIFVTLRIKQRDRYLRMRVLPRASGWSLLLEGIVSANSLLHQVIVEHRRWAAVIAGTDDGIAFVDEQGVIMEHNAAFFRMMSFKSRHGIALSEESIVGKQLFSLLPESSLQAVYDALKHSKPRMRRYQGTLALGDKYLDVELSPTILPGEGFLGCNLVTRDRTAQQQLVDLRLEHARAAGMSEVACGVLHNVGNILNGMSVSSSVISEQVRTSKLFKLRKAVAMLVGKVQAEERLVSKPEQEAKLVQYMEELISVLEREQSSLLDESRLLSERIGDVGAVIMSQQRYARKGPLLKDCRLHRLINNAISLVGLDKEEDVIQTEVQCDNQLSASVDSHQVTQILVNLLSNARDAVLTDDAGAKRIKVRVLPPVDDKICIQVSDEGEGIAAENVTRVFSHGFTTKPQGHGFGLHDSANAATAMGGRLQCRSEGKGRGSTFTLTFPDKVQSQ